MGACANEFNDPSVLSRNQIAHLPDLEILSGVSPHLPVL